MSYIINPRTGRKVLIGGKIGKRLLKQYGSGCNDIDSGYCDLNFNDDNTPKVNRDGSYSCIFKSMPGNSKSKRYRRKRGLLQNKDYCSCNISRGRCNGENSNMVPYQAGETLPATLSQKKKLRKQAREKTRNIPQQSVKSIRKQIRKEEAKNLFVQILI